MTSLMDDSRTLRSEQGFALIEVIVAAAVLAIVALAVLSGIDAASSTSAREKARAVAASLAEQDQERLRAMTYEQIQKKPTVDQQDPVNVDGVTYDIQSEAKLVTDDIGGTPECGDEGTQVTYVHIVSTVSSTIVGKRIRPVKVDSLVPPTQKWAEGHGTLGVKVVDRSAVKGVPAIPVTASSTAYTPPVASTDENGCVVFKDVPIGTYTITLDKPGYLDRDAKQLSQVTATVVRKKVVFATMSYDLADTIKVDVLTHTPGKTWADATAQHKPSKARKVSTTNGANVGLFTTVTPSAPASTMDAQGLFPFAENSYTFFTGGCKYTSPDKVSTPANPNYFSTIGGVNSAAAVLADPAILIQPATVRQPPFNIRVASTRNGATFLDSNMEVWATLVKPSAYSTDSCAEARFQLATMTWDATLFGAKTPNDHWVTQRGGTFDPGMPFGTYSLCLRDNNLRRRAYVSENYDNTNPEGRTNTVTIDGDDLSWSSAGSTSSSMCS